MPARRFIPPRSRRSGFRDARLIIVAAEGTHTEKRYLDDLATTFANPRLHVEVLDRLETASDPLHVIELLDEFRKDYSFKKDYDELWLVIDVDRWRERSLSTVAERCAQASYKLAVSNPCFEIWLLLHLKSLDEYQSSIRNEFMQNAKVGQRTRLEHELVTLLGEYNKSHPDTTRFLPNIRLAIARARALDIHPEHRWPNDPGTRVYLLAERIIARQD